MKLAEVNEEYEQIVKSGEDQEVKNSKQSDLMTRMERHYKIPALRNEEWEKENKAIIAMYRKIARSRT